MCLYYISELRYVHNSVIKLVWIRCHTLVRYIPEEPRICGRRWNKQTWGLIFKWTKSNGCRSVVCDATLWFSQQIYNIQKKHFLRTQIIFYLEFHREFSSLSYFVFVKNASLIVVTRKWCRLIQIPLIKRLK